MVVVMAVFVYWIEREIDMLFNLMVIVSQRYVLRVALDFRLSHYGETTIIQL